MSREMEGNNFGDRRLETRAPRILESLGSSPKQSVNASFVGHASTAAAYRFLKNPKVTPDRLLSAHRLQSLERASAHPSVLLIQDTSEADFTSLATLKGAGPLSCKERRGAFLHTSLMVAPGGMPLGLHDIDFMVRRDEEHGKRETRKSRPIEEKESHRWLEGYRKACELNDGLEDTGVISVADREADIYEVFAEWQKRRDEGETPADFVIRASENRVLEGKHEGRKLFDLDQEGEALGEIEFEVPAATQRYKVKGNTRISHRRKRRVKQELRAHRISLRPPARKGRKLPPVELFLVTATEVGTPADQRPVNWRLLTSKPVETLEEAREIIGIYRDRWQIEVYFKVLKSGCRVEELGLKEMKGLERAITMLGIVAWRQLHVTHLAREAPETPCGEVFETHEWEGALRVLEPGREKYEEPTLGQFILKVAKLGGYLDRKHDPPPGSEVLWRGMLKVEAYGEAWLAFSKSN